MVATGVMATYPGINSASPGPSPGPSPGAPKNDDTTAKFLNIAWYWWIVIVIAFLIVAFFARAVLSKSLGNSKQF